MNKRTYNVTAGIDESLDQVCCLFNGYIDKFDAIGNPIRQKAPMTEVFCAEHSLPSSEFYRAGTSGIELELELVIDSESYDNQTHVLYDESEYRIYRRYRRDNGLLELYLVKEE